MAKIILNPEVYPTWPLDNGLLLFNDKIFMDKNDLYERSALKNRSTLDYKINNYYKILREDLKIIQEVDYPTILPQDERKKIHQLARTFVNDPKNFKDVYIIARQAWDNYTSYLMSKLRYYDDPSEPAISVIKKKIDDTVYWRNRLFISKKYPDFNDEEVMALKNAAIRTLSKSLAGVTIYQKFLKTIGDESYDFLIHDGNEYRYAFSIAAKLILKDDAEPFIIKAQSNEAIVTDIIYECYKVYSVRFNLPLIEKPDLLYNMRKRFETYRNILNELQILMSKFSYDYRITRNYVLHHLERILNHLKMELLSLSKTVGRTWETIGSVSFFNVPIGHLIRLLIERKVSEKIIQKKINDFFMLYQNKGWRNLFVMLKSFEEFEKLNLTEGLKTIDGQYLEARPDWWIDYLPWYEGGSKFIKI